jgi:hypothetical protein
MRNISLERSAHAYTCGSGCMRPFFYVLMCKYFHVLTRFFPTAHEMAREAWLLVLIIASGM